MEHVGAVSQSEKPFLVVALDIFYCLWVKSLVRALLFIDIHLISVGLISELRFIVLDIGYLLSLTELVLWLIVHVCCVPALVWFCSAISHPATPTSCDLRPARCSTARQLELPDWGIMRNRSYWYLLRTQQHKVFPTKGLEEELVFVSFLRFCSGVNMDCFILKMVWYVVILVHDFLSALC